MVLRHQLAHLERVLGVAHVRHQATRNRRLSGLTVPPNALLHVFRIGSSWSVERDRAVIPSTVAFTGKLRM